MKRTFSAILLTSAIPVVFTGCISHTSVEYRDATRTAVEFESDAAARLFYETLSKGGGGRRDSTEEWHVEIPFVFDHHGSVQPGRNVAFNQAVAACDTNKDGKITEAESRIFANQRR